MRRVDWIERLNDHLLKSQRDGHIYGVNDCVLFGRNCVVAMTGEDDILPIDGLAYKTKTGGLLRLRKAGYDCAPWEAVAYIVDGDFSRIPVRDALIGDLCLVVSQKAFALGIRTSVGFTVMTADGLATASPRICWRIP